MGVGVTVGDDVPVVEGVGVGVIVGVEVPVGVLVGRERLSFLTSGKKI